MPPEALTEAGQREFTELPEEQKQIIILAIHEEAEMMKALLSGGAVLNYDEAKEHMERVLFRGVGERTMVFTEEGDVLFDAGGGPVYFGNYLEGARILRDDDRVAIDVKRASANALQILEKIEALVGPTKGSA